jgi:hypothetical protein
LVSCLYGCRENAIFVVLGKRVVGGDIREKLIIVGNAVLEKAREKNEGSVVKSSVRIESKMSK